MRRYSSAEQFAADIRRHLENIPVLARQDSAAYRVSKFVSRHKLGVMAFAVVVLAILSGLAAALYEAHLARQQREIARAQRIRAERRFNDVRKLANSLMFEIHDSIRDLPGATQARKLLVSQALEYLDSLSQESNGDAALQRELAAAYDRVGDVLGYEGRANLGDFSGAIQSYNKALAIREASAAANPSDVQMQTDLFNDYFRLSFALQSANDYAGALSDLKKAVPVAQNLASSSDDPKFQDWLAGVHWQTGNILNRNGQFSKALEEYRISSSIREPLVQKTPANVIFRTHLASDYGNIGQMLWRTGDIEQALQVSKRALLMLEDLSRSNPNDATLREYLGEAYSLLQPILLEHQDLDESLECGRKGLQIFESLAGNDPTNSLAAANLASTEIVIGETLVQKRRIKEAMKYTRHALNLFENRQPKTPYDVAHQAEAYLILGLAHESLADYVTAASSKAVHLHDAKIWLRKSIRTSEEDVSLSPADPLASGNLERARKELARCERALSKL